MTTPDPQKMTGVRVMSSETVYARIVKARARFMYAAGLFLVSGDVDPFSTATDQLITATAREMAVIIKERILARWARGVHGDSISDIDALLADLSGVPHGEVAHLGHVLLKGSEPASSPTDLSPVPLPDVSEPQQETGIERMKEEDLSRSDQSGNIERLTHAATTETASLTLHVCGGSICPKTGKEHDMSVEVRLKDGGSLACRDCGVTAMQIDMMRLP
jgi:hypothetical protein